MRSRIYNQYIQGHTSKYVYDKKKVLNMFADIFGDYCCCSVHIDNHTGDREAKSSRGNRNHSVGAGLSKNIFLWIIKKIYAGLTKIKLGRIIQKYFLRIIQNIFLLIIQKYFSTDYPKYFSPDYPKYFSPDYPKKIAADYPTIFCAGLSKNIFIKKLRRIIQQYFVLDYPKIFFSALFKNIFFQIIQNISCWIDQKKLRRIIQQYFSPDYLKRFLHRIIKKILFVNRNKKLGLKKQNSRDRDVTL